MLHAMPAAKTCPEAWVAAARYLFDQPGREAFNLILSIEEPLRMTPGDFRVFDDVDQFLRNHDQNPLNTVAGTIFPVGFYDGKGAAGVYEDYPKIAEKVCDGWGRYAMRMVRHPDNEGGVMNPLERLVRKLKTQVGTGRPFKAAYEASLLDPVLDLSTYDPAEDAGRLRNAPCLSYLSFKVLPTRKLMMTVFYRYHYYIAKTLGNLIGLAQLQGFICREAGIAAGPMVCISTYATIDKEGGWGVADIRSLIERCETALHTDAV